MNAPSNQGPCQRRYSRRHQTRLDAEMHAMLEEMARAFQRKRSAILRYVMPWGLGRMKGWTTDWSPVVAVPRVPMLLEPELLQGVQNAATAHGVSMATWLREAVRRVTADDFPAGWRPGDTDPRSHDSRFDGERFMLRLNADTQTTLQDFLPSWQMAAMEHRPPEARPGDGGADSVR